jgi:hypothetical protein
MSTKLVTYSCSGSYDKTKNFLMAFLEINRLRSLFDQYGQRIVAELSANTPKRTGETAASWSYEVVQDESSLSLEIHNSKMGDDGKTPVALLIQMGHGTRTGGYVPPNDYINPVVQPLFDELNAKIAEVVKSK